MTIMHMQEIQTTLKNTLKTVIKYLKIHYPETISFNILVNVFLKFLIQTVMQEPQTRELLKCL